MNRDSTEHPLAKMTRLDEEMSLYDDGASVPLSPNLVLEVFPCLDVTGNIRCYDLGPPTEPGATHGCVVASVYSGKATADELARLWNTRSAQPIGEEKDSDAIQGNCAGEGAALDDLDEIEPVYQGLRTYAQNRRLLVLSIADLRRAARAAITALKGASHGEG